MFHNINVWVELTRASKWINIGWTTYNAVCVLVVVVVTDRKDFGRWSIGASYTLRARALAIAAIAAQGSCTDRII